MGTTKRLPEAGKNGDSAGITLLANGSSGPWGVDIDEIRGDRDRYFAQVEGPALYLYFEVLSLQTISTALQFLQRKHSSPVAGNGAVWSASTQSLRIGKTFGRASVNLIWDDEFADRCFLVVGVSGKNCLRLTLAGEDIRHFSKALRQVVEDLDTSESSDLRPQPERRS